MFLKNLLMAFSALFDFENVEYVKVSEWIYG